MEQHQMAGPEGPSESIQGNSAPPMEEESRRNDYSDDLDMRIEQEREFFRQKKKLDERERYLSEKEQELSKPRDYDSIINDLLRQDEPEKEEQKEMSHEELIAEAKRQLREELDREKEEEYMEMEAHETYEGFISGIDDMLSEHIEDFPLAASMGIGFRIAEDLNQELEQLAEEYGEEYAERYLERLDWGEVMTSYENDLAENFATMLQSPQVRKKLSSYLGNSEQMPSGEPPRTLRQADLGSSRGTGLESMSEEQRVAYIKDTLRKQRLQQMS